MSTSRVSASVLQHESLVWDGHAGFEYDPRNDLTNLFRWQDAGVNFLSVNVGYDVKPWHLTLQALANYRAFIKQHPDRLRLVFNVKDIERAKGDGVMAIAFDIEGMNALNTDLAMIAFYYDLGVRQMLVAYNLNNAAGGGCHDVDVGLTPFGRAAIGEMNRIGMLVDCSHTSYKSSMEIMEMSEAPVIYSHANARRLHDHERNIHDDQIKSCASTGGLVSVTGIGLFLSPDGASVERLLDHIVYISDLIGVDKVGIGLDYAFSHGALFETAENNRRFWPESQYPDGLDIGYLPPECLPDITEALLKRGFSELETAAVIGGNYLRVAGEVWK